MLRSWAEALQPVRLVVAGAGGAQPEIFVFLADAKRQFMRTLTAAAGKIDKCKAAPTAFSAVLVCSRQGKWGQQGEQLDNIDARPAGTEAGRKATQTRQAARASPAARSAVLFPKSGPKNPRDFFARWEVETTRSDAPRAADD